ncbi:MAG: SOS response-associated peptidase [SAR202 cluster bacterium]|nr:SOS response-associated peptidase [SAR202 cluster bacterium]MDP7224069.1 SOS response-associated peptidase [SAR202 cluster bacterium]MDP7533300.1 SOS response-associated peptidase [SAR202 cluster bacterium]
MCGRFTLTAHDDALADAFSFTQADLGWVPSYNIAPTQQVLVVTNDGSENRAHQMRWGLVPSWAKDASIGNRMINARAETAAEKPSFRTAFKKRRCLVLADSYYEWKKTGGKKTPMRIMVGDGELFAFAGLWEYWHPSDDEGILSCTIVTTAANSFMETIHNRMPVILPRESAEAWLDPSIEDAATVSELLLPYDSDAMIAHEVSTFVNSPRNNTPDCIAPVQSLL